MATKFEAGDPFQQQPLERRKIIEASHEAARKMAEMLGQDANFHSEGAQSGQHAALPLPKEDRHSPQEIKLFLPNRETKEDVEGYIPLTDSQQDDRQAEENQRDYFSDEVQDTFGDEENLTEDSTFEEGELITDILERRAAYLYMAFQPPEPVEGPADTLFIVRRSKHDSRRVFIRAHSQVLKRTNDAFNELIGYRPPMTATPSNAEEAEKTGMPISWKEEKTPSRQSMYLKLLYGGEPDRKNKYEQAVSQSQQQSFDQDENNQTMDNEETDYSPSQTRPKKRGLGNVHFSVDDFENESNANPNFIRDNISPSKVISMGNGQRLTFQPNDRITLSLGNVIGDLQDSIKPSTIKAFLDASQNLIQLPGWDHLPTDLKESFQTFATEVKKFKNSDTETPADVGGHFEIDGKSLESTFLGMVGRRNSKQMLGILNNISQGIAERRASSILLEQAKREELEGVPGNDISAKLPRTIFEKRKSQTFFENQQRRESMATIDTQMKRRGTLTNYDKRISISFLERRRSKAIKEIAKESDEKLQIEEMNLRRKASTAAMAAFERQKRMSVLEEKRTNEVEFSGGHDRKSMWNPNANAVPSFEVNEQKILSNTKAASYKTSRTSQGVSDLGSHSGGKTQNQRKSTAHFESPKSPKSPEMSYTGRRPSELPTLRHTREEDKAEVAQFFANEDRLDAYSTTSSSSLEPEPAPLPKDVEFVIEKMHWTSDVLHGVMEFIYSESIHIHCEELPDIYKAANEILLSSLTDAIRLKPINQYFRLAMTTDENRIALLNLADQLTTSADYDNYVNKNEDFMDLKKLCAAFEINGPRQRMPYKLFFETGHVAFKNLPFVTPGLHTIDGHMMLILEDPREGTRLYEQNLEQDDYLTFKKKTGDQANATVTKEMDWLGEWPAIEKTRNREKAWKIYFFSCQDLERDIPLRNFSFYKHISSLSMLPIGREELSVRLVCGLLICPVLYKALHIAFPQLAIIAGRGAGYYLGGETHGNNITMTGSPYHLLQACKSLPRHMIGRTVLRVSSPCERTFVKLWKSTNRFGVDLECNVLYFLKPLIQIQKMLEFWHDLDAFATYVVTHPREMVELVEPHDPF